MALNNHYNTEPFNYDNNNKKISNVKILIYRIPEIWGVGKTAAFKKAI